MFALGILDVAEAQSGNRKKIMPLPKFLAHSPSKKTLFWLQCDFAQRMIFLDFSSNFGFLKEI